MSADRPQPVNVCASLQLGYATGGVTRPSCGLDYAPSCGLDYAPSCGLGYAPLLRGLA